MLKCYKYIYNSDTKSVFFFAHCKLIPAPFPCIPAHILKYTSRKEGVFSQRNRGQRWSTKGIFNPYAQLLPDVFFTIDNNLYSKSGLEGSQT